MPTAAKIASSSVGGSRRTRRVPYFVFQSSLIGASQSDCRDTYVPSCCIAIRISHGNTAMRLQSLKSGSVIQFDGGGLIGELLQRSHELARGRDCKMHPQGRAIGPLLEKHQPQRVFAIDMHGMRDAAGLGTRTPDMLEAQFQHLV